MLVDVAWEIRVEFVHRKRVSNRGRDGDMDQELRRESITGEIDDW